jgi:hypothetical protein
LNQIFICYIIFIKNFKNDVLENIYDEEEIEPLWTVDIGNLNEKIELLKIELYSGLCFRFSAYNLKSFLPATRYSASNGVDFLTAF